MSGKAESSGIWTEAYFSISTRNSSLGTMGKFQEPSVPSSIQGSHLTLQYWKGLSAFCLLSGSVPRDNREITAPEGIGHLLAEASIHTIPVSFHWEARQAVTQDRSRGLIKQHSKFYTTSFTPQHNSHTSPGFILSWILLKSLSFATRH